MQRCSCKFGHVGDSHFKLSGRLNELERLFVLAEVKHHIVRFLGRNRAFQLEPQPRQMQAYELNLLSRPRMSGVLHRISVHR